MRSLLCLRKTPRQTALELNFLLSEVLISTRLAKYNLFYTNQILGKQFLPTNLHNFQQNEIGNKKMKGTKYNKIYSKSINTRKIH